MSSSAQPVTGIDPAMPVALSGGVSMNPKGYVLAPDGTTVSVTDTGPAVLPAPVSARVIDPVLVPLVGSALVNTTLAVSVAVPLPDVGDTMSHGWFDVAVQRDRAGSAALREAHRLRARLRRERWRRCSTAEN